MFKFSVFVAIGIFALSHVSYASIQPSAGQIGLSNTVTIGANNVRKAGLQTAFGITDFLELAVLFDASLGKVGKSTMPLVGGRAGLNAKWDVLGASFRVGQAIIAGQTVSDAYALNLSGHSTSAEVYFHLPFSITPFAVAQRTSSYTRLGNTVDYSLQAGAIAELPGNLNIILSGNPYRKAVTVGVALFYEVDQLK